MVLREQVHCCSGSSKGPVFDDESEMPVFVEDNEAPVDITCGVREFVRRSSLRNSFRRSRRVPHWITSKFALIFTCIKYKIGTGVLLRGNAIDQHHRCMSRAPQYRNSILDQA